uniref:Uncharacterized protein n=1 Tax=Pelagomonas calceolata TaxID=35677 RepID=A0A6S8U3S3_9STRA
MASFDLDNDARPQPINRRPIDICKAMCVPYVMSSSMRKRSWRSNRRDSRSPVPAITIPNAIDIVARHISKVGRSGRQASECSRMTGSKRALLWEVCFDSRVTTPGTKSHAFLRALNRIKKYLRVAAAIAQPVPA